MPIPVCSIASFDLFTYNNDVNILRPAAAATQNLVDPLLSARLYLIGTP